MATVVDKEGVNEAYKDVRADISPTNWALFKYEKNRIVHEASGIDFDEIKDKLSDEDRAFGFVRVSAGDEMSKRKKFVFLTWIGPNVNPLKRARVSTDKALVKQVIQNFSVELQMESSEELTEDYLLSEVTRVGGANYGTGIRE